MTHTDYGWAAFLKDAMVGMTRNGHNDIAILGMGIVAAHEFGLSLAVGYATAATGMVILLARTLWRLRTPVLPHVPYDIPHQAEIDEAWEAGYRVWTMVPRSNATATSTLDALRQNGYLLTDRKGRLIDAAVERVDAPSMRRRAFRVVELEPPSGKSECPKK